MVCSVLSGLSIYVAYEYTSKLAPFLIEQYTLLSFLFVFTICKASGWKVPNSMWLKHMLIFGGAYVGKVYVSERFYGVYREYSAQVNLAVILYLIICSLIHNPHMLINTTGSLLLQTSSVLTGQVWMAYLSHGFLGTFC